MCVNSAPLELVKVHVTAASWKKENTDLQKWDTSGSQNIYLVHITVISVLDYMNADFSP